MSGSKRTGSEALGSSNGSPSKMARVQTYMRADEEEM